MTRIGVLVPHRNDKPEFLKQFQRLLTDQSLQPTEVCFMDYEPINEDVDITARYRKGCEYLFKERKMDVVLFMEFDDWYSPHYIATMIRDWKSKGQPECFGLESTIYYHIFGKKWLNIRHKGRASCFTTLVTPAVLRMKWPRDNDPYLDIEIWKQLHGIVILPTQTLAIGIKHGIGLVGGGAHDVENKHYQYEDPKGEWLLDKVGEKNYEFYNNLKLCLEK